MKKMKATGKALKPKKNMTGSGFLLIITIALFVVMYVAGMIVFGDKGFAKPQMFFNLFVSNAGLIVIAMGETIIMITAGIDISVGSVTALVCMVIANQMENHGASAYTALLMALVIGLLFGLVQGFLVSYLEIQPFIVTLATMNIARGLAKVYTGGSPVRVVTKEWQFIGAGYIGPVPVPVIIMIIAIIITALMMNKTKLGRHIYAVGGNTQAAEFSGIKVARVKFIVHAYAGLMAGLAGIILASRMYSGQPTAGEGAEMDAIAAVVVGGTSMAGGSGKIGGTIIGALIIGVLNNGLNLMNVNSFWQDVVKGVVILLAVFIDYIRNRK